MRIPVFPGTRRTCSFFYAALVLTLLFGMQTLPAHAQATQEVHTHLQAIGQLTEQALDASRAAEKAGTVADVKTGADAVFESIWGRRSGLAEGRTGAASVHGWKTRWQVDNSDFDEAFAERYGTTPPETTNPAQLGIVGRGRYARKQIEAIRTADAALDAQKMHAEHVIASLNNVIGWMKIDDGVTKAERQPRVDLTRMWDAPSAFWLSSADTGWLHEVYAQALNILKTDYGDDVATARSHAAGMTRLLEKCLDGVDENEDGNVQPTMMEGGLRTALQHAQLGGFLSD